MEGFLSNNDKFDVQQNFRRFLKYQDQYEVALEQQKVAKASRLWIAGVVSMLFAPSSDFFIGAAAALFAVYFYRVVSAKLGLNRAEEGRESSERWFGSKGLKFEGRVLYRRDDQLLENPLDPFDDALFS